MAGEATPAVPSSTPASAAPAPASTPAASTPSPAAPQTSAPEITPAPETAAPAASPVGGGHIGNEPKQGDYATIEDFLRAHNDWDALRTPAEDADPAENVPSAEQVAEDAGGEVVPTEETAQDAPAEPEVADDAPPLTPEGLSALFEGNPALKAAVEQTPAVRDALYGMAKENARLAPMGELFPNIESAQFASVTASRYVGMKTAFSLAPEDPGGIESAYSMFAKEFEVVDANGQPVLDAKGQPTYAEDFDMFNRFVVDRSFQSSLGSLEEKANALKAKIDANTASPREQAEYSDTEDLISAYKFIQAAEKGEGSAISDRPDLSDVPAHVRDYIEKRERELAEKEGKLSEQKQTQTREARTAARQAHEKQYRETVGSTVGNRIRVELEKREQAGAFIPRYVLEMKDPKDGVPVFAKNIFMQFNAEMKRDAKMQSHLAQLQLKPATPETLAERVTYLNQIADALLPRLIKAELAKVQSSETRDAQRRQTSRDAAQSDARVEPRSGGPARPTVLTPQQAYEKAVETVNARMPHLSETEKIAAALKEKDRLLTAPR